MRGPAADAHPHALAGDDGREERWVDEVEDLVQLVVGAHGGVVEEHQLADAGLGGDDDRLLDRGVAVEVGEGSLGLGELGVVEEHVDALDEVPHLRGDALRRGVVGEVRERSRLTRHPVAQGATALVVDLDRGHLELLDGRGARGIGQEPPGAEQPLRLDGERRRREHPGQQVPRRGAVLRRDVQVDPASSWSTARQNGRPSTWSQCRWLSRIDPRNGSEPISAERERIPVPASISRVGAVAPSARTATHDV